MEAYIFLAIAALAILLLLSIRPVRMFLLGMLSWALRAAVIAGIAFGAYAAIYPGQIPEFAAEMLNRLRDSSALLTEYLPPIDSPAFGPVFACMASVLLIPALAIIDSIRGSKRDRRVEPVRTETPAAAAVERSRAFGEGALPEEREELIGSPATPSSADTAELIRKRKRLDRRGAAEAMARLGANRNRSSLSSGGGSAARTSQKSQAFDRKRS